MTTLVFTAVTAVCIVVGSLGVIIGIPGNYGLTTAEALAVLDGRPMGWTAVWVGYALAVYVGALARARHIARRKPGMRGTRVRGSIWLWGAIGGPWIGAWLAWDLQLYDFSVAGVEPIATDFAFVVATWWWMGSLACLVVAAAWSVWIMSRPEPLGRS